jgi:hypothetical protein
MIGPMERLNRLFGSLLVFVYHCFDRVVINGYLSGLSRPECMSSAEMGILGGRICGEFPPQMMVVECFGIWDLGLYEIISLPRQGSYTCWSRCSNHGLVEIAWGSRRDEGGS